MENTIQFQSNAMLSRASSRRSEAEGYAILIFKVQDYAPPTLSPEV